jgi:lactate dehydrogenase-like 2-hydroxyacid dehydrogenase
VRVTNTHDVLTEDVADFAFALILAGGATSTN